jgi:hypothetical protein
MRTRMSRPGCCVGAELIRGGGASQPDREPAQGSRWRFHRPPRRQYVDVVNINEYGWYDVAGNIHISDLHLTERRTVIDNNVLRYEVLNDDRKLFARPWISEMNTRGSRRKASSSGRMRALRESATKRKEQFAQFPAFPRNLLDRRGVRCTCFVPGPRLSRESR